MKTLRTPPVAPSLSRALLLLSSLLSLPFVAPRLSAQERRDSTRAAELERVTVTVTRDAARTPLELPFATARVTPDATRPGLRRTGIGDLLLGVPGVVVQDRANPSQDPRLAVRGFGARSAFGVRGVRVLRDGIPLSLPDGQTPIDWLDLETVEAIDVVRGTAAALYGNAAGGVVDFRSRDPLQGPFSVVSRVIGGGGLTRANVTLGGRYPGDSAGAPRDAALRDAGVLASVSTTHGDVGRTWSRLDASSVFARAYGTFLGTRLEVQGTRYDAPRAENTGALTAAELARDVALPDSLNITKQSRKAVLHSQFALIASRTHGDASWTASVFTSARTLDNPWPFAIVAVDRNVSGGSARLNWRTTGLGWPVRLTAGGDVQLQDDDRKNFENCADVLPTAPVTVRCPVSSRERGALRLDQQETVRGTGVFVRGEVEAPHRVFASAAIRHDAVAFRVRDRFVTATSADDSGDRTLRAFSPMFAVAWRIRPLLSVYANVATAFETPTITELTNQDDGSAGLNRALAPQRTSTTEVGVQGIAFSRVRWDLAAFRARVRDELVPFDVPNQPGRRAFRNAGRTTRNGVEASLGASAGIMEFGTAYSASRFRFDRYSVGAANYAGKPIPGIPEQQLQAWSTARWRGLHGTVDVSAVSRVSADDAATVFAAGYSTWAVRAGYAAKPVGRRLQVEPMAGVENLFDRRYATSVVINATRFRSYEPGTRRRAFLGVRVAVQ